MKKLIVAIFLFFTIFNELFSQDSKILFSIATKMDGLIISGASPDVFNKGIGVGFDFGIQKKSIYIGYLGFDVYRNRNIIGDSEVNCTFLTVPFLGLDWRFDLYKNQNQRFKVFTSATIAPQLMFVEGTSGVDYTWIYATSLGTSYRISEKNILLFHIRPYLVSGNQLMKGTSRPGGVEFKLALGWMEE